MKKFKKVLAAVLAMAMVLGMSVTSMASETSGSPGSDGKMGTSDDTGTITVNGIEEKELEIKAYQIIKAKYADGELGAFLGYELVYGDEDLPEGTNIEQQLGLKKNEVPKDPKDLEKTDFDLTLVSILAEKVRKDGTAVGDVTLDNGTATIRNLPVGTYLILIENAETKVYNPMIASISYKAATATGSNTGNQLEQGNIDIKGANVWVKVSDEPHVEKEIVASPSNVNHNNINIGDTVKFSIPVTPIPNYGGTHPVFKIVDTLSKGLTFNDDLKVTVVKKDGTTVELKEENKDYSLIPNGQVIEVNFVVDGEYKLNTYATESLEIEYSATLNKDADVNNSANENNVDLIYSKDSTTTATDSNSDKTYTYTFDIDGKATVTEGILTKKDGIATSSNVLPGAEFTLYTDDPSVNANAPTFSHNVGEDVLFDGKVTNGIVISDEEGQLRITGLKEGTYYLKETRAPEGYSLNTQVFKIEIKNLQFYDKGENEGKLKGWDIFINDNKTASFTVDTEGKVSYPPFTGVVIPNTKLSSLPSTGGIGTTIFTLGGCAIMIIAAGLYFASRRKKNEE